MGRELRLPPRGGRLGVRTLPGLSCAAGVCSNHGGVVGIVAVLLRCLLSKAESRVAWLSYGVIAVMWRGREHRGGFIAFSVRDGGVVICMAFLLSFKSLRSRDKHSNFSLQGSRSAPREERDRERYYC